jgi:hypothetical protein
VTEEDPSRVERKREKLERKKKVKRERLFVESGHHQPVVPVGFSSGGGAESVTSSERERERAGLRDRDVDGDASDRRSSAPIDRDMRRYYSTNEAHYGDNDDCATSSCCRLCDVEVDVDADEEQRHHPQWRRRSKEASVDGSPWWWVPPSSPHSSWTNRKRKRRRGRRRCCWSSASLTHCWSHGGGSVLLRVSDVLQRWRYSLASLLFFLIIVTDNFGLTSSSVVGNFGGESPLLCTIFKKRYCRFEILSLPRHWNSLP